MDECKRICLWSGPRNISTAFMYSFAQRSDTRVYDEPLYGYYLQHSPARAYHPGAEEVIASMETKGQKIVEMIMGPHDKPVAFFKHMTHHLMDLDRSFLARVENIILTRDPVEMLPSYARQVADPTLADVGYSDQVDLLQYLKSIGKEPVVIDASEVLLDPRKTLQTVCRAVGISLDERMLQWAPGPRKEDGVWAKFWYEKVHKSTGFQAYKPKSGPFPDKLKPLLEACEPLYAELIDSPIH